MGLRYIGVRYIEDLYHTFYYYWVEKYRSLYVGLRYIGVCYIGDLFHTFYYYWAEEYPSLYRGLSYIGVRYIGDLYHTSYYYLAEEYRSLHRVPLLRYLFNLTATSFWVREFSRIRLLQWNHKGRIVSSEPCWLTFGRHDSYVRP